MLRALAGLLIAAVLVPQAWAADIAARLDALLAGTRTLQAEFVQTVFDETGRPLQDSHGVVYIHRPDRFRWDYRTPSAQQIVADGRRIWVYDEELEQVTVRPMDEALGNTPALLLMHEGHIAEVFSVNAIERPGELEWLELLPRSDSAGFERFRLALDEHQIRIMEMVDNFGQTTALRFQDAQHNIELPAELFEFTPPPGVDVIEGQ